MAKIYLSSTFWDLEGHRRAVFDQLVSMKHQVVAMEHYVAMDERPANRCIADVLGSDVYVGILAWRYGFVPDGGEASITEREYRAAGENNIPRLMFVLDPNAPWPAAQMDFTSGENGSGARIRAFREEVERQNSVNHFTTADQLASRVAAALHVATTVADASDVDLQLQQLIGGDLSPEVLFSSSGSFFLIDGLVKRSSDARIVTIDLQDNAYWWSTRLYALATLFREFTAVEWLAFIERDRRFVGMARPSAVRRALAAQQPRLEACYFEAQSAFEDRPRDAGAVLTGLLMAYDRVRGQEDGLRFYVSSSWLAEHVVGFERSRVEASGAIDPLALYELTKIERPFVAVTDRAGKLEKIVDRAAVVSELAQQHVRSQIRRR